MIIAGAWILAAVLVAFGWFLGRRVPCDPSKCDFCRHTPIRRVRR